MVILSVPNVDVPWKWSQSRLVGVEHTKVLLTLSKTPPTPFLPKKIQQLPTKTVVIFWEKLFKTSKMSNPKKLVSWKVGSQTLGSKNSRSSRPDLTTGVTGCSISSKVCRSASLKACVTEGTMRPKQRCIGGDGPTTWRQSGWLVVSTHLKNTG